ncbi:MAG: ShlB/FhaC/HecB family hemolysin secretion/activation protein [Desulfuromonadaceae bacterium]|nr:ShlB/FhaC/HecB family hemolysin secretion/activation protein [Desulfuromonadaceae bacterium]
MNKFLFWVAAGLLLCTTPVRAEEGVVPRFDIQQINLEGNSILPSSEVATILGRYTGPQKDFGTLQEAIDELEAAYRKWGYTMVTVLLPEQELEQGTVTINVLEPVVKEITVDGNQHYSRENILHALPTLKVGVPPRVTAISENLRAANENPGRKLTLQFKSDEKETDLTAQVKVADQKPWRVSLGGDNTGSDLTGKYRTSLGFQHSNLFDLDHVIALQYITSPDHFEKVQIFSGSYRIPLYNWGDTLDLFGAYSAVDSGTTQISGTNIAVSGKGIISGFRYNMTLPRADKYEQKLIGGVDYRLYDNTADVLGTNVARDVLAHPLSLSYGGVWTIETVTLDGSVGLLYNIPWGGLGQKDDFEAARGGATANYLIARYGLNALARPGADWMLHFSAAGQYSNDRLIPGEQFGLGGSTSIRGYEEREESWDDGFSSTAEIYSPDLARLMAYSKAQLRLVAFYDGGYGYNRSPIAGELSSHSLNGVGTGVRLAVGEHLNFSLDWGHALDNSTTTKSGTNRIYFKASLSY